MKLEGGLTGFEPVTRGMTYAWNNGTRIYLQFHTESGKVEGNATYDAEEDAWTVNYYGTIVKGEKTPCEVYYFDNPDTVTNNSVELGPNSTVYYEAEGHYYFEGGVILLYADMKPLTGRVRFLGNPGSEVAFSGLAYFNKYIPKNGSLTMTGGNLKQTIGEDGYSPYVYANFADTVERRIAFYSDGYRFLRNNPRNMLAVGNSGFIRVPSLQRRNGWTMIEGDMREFYVNGVAFSMIRVEPGSYQVGVTKQEYGTSFLYKYTISLTKPYYIGETEVTADLWSVVMEPEYILRAPMRRPASSISWEDCQTFVKRLSALTGVAFRLPTEAEWEHAARGGSMSKGFTYSGSNNLDEVAWYAANSGNTRHEVKGKKPNELGIYDMSGNVQEWCQDWYASYPASNQVDPTGPSTGTERVSRGGYYGDSGTGCMVDVRWGIPSGQWSNFGFRIASW
jgi:formylglycine-generating enzyme required for sulfatase activity